MIKSFPELKVNLKPHIWDVQQIPSRLSAKNTRLTEIKCRNSKDKERRNLRNNNE